jgi:hypothetical protein
MLTIILLLIFVIVYGYFHFKIHSKTSIYEFGADWIIGKRKNK